MEGEFGSREGIRGGEGRKEAIIMGEATKKGTRQKEKDKNAPAGVTAMAEGIWVRPGRIGLETRFEPSRNKTKSKKVALAYPIQRQGWRGLWIMDYFAGARQD